MTLTTPNTYVRDQSQTAFPTRVGATISPIGASIVLAAVVGQGLCVKCSGQLRRPPRDARRKNDLLGRVYKPSDDAINPPMDARRRIVILALVLSSGGPTVGCAHGKPAPTGPSVADGWVETIDWRSAGDEAVAALSRYLQIDTTNPPGNETRGARWLAAVLAREGIESRIVEFAAGRGSLIARLRGRGGAREPPLCLLSHIDVVPAKASEWPAGRGPLSGAIDDAGMLWGRGALDMKGMGVLELMTMLWLKRARVPLARDVILLAVADEEVHNRGMRFIVDRHWGSIGCSHLVNEGGIGLRGVLFENHTAFGISIAEKGVLWLKMTVRGKGGHGSTPYPDHTPLKLLDAIARIRQRIPAVRVHQTWIDFFREIGTQRAGISGFLLRRPGFVRTVVAKQLMKQPGTRAALIDTIAITGLDTGGNAPNVVPTEASARLDCRLLPGSTAEQVEAELRRLVGDDPSIRFERIQYAPAMISPTDDPFYRALATQAVRGRSNAAVGPVVSPGFTDSMYARRVGARAYGFVPFVIDEALAKTMHAPRERVSLDNVRRGLRALFAAIVEFVAAGPVSARPSKRLRAPRFVDPQPPGGAKRG